MIYALAEARRSGTAEIVGVLTTVNEAYDRVAMHGLRNSLLHRQIAALGLPCLKVPLPNPCPMAAYEARISEASATMKVQGVDHVVFGDLFLEDLRAYREGQFTRAGMTGMFPLWGRETRALAEAMIAGGLVA
jgi:diphthamide synthase (EF-2-diphthine--ammonia ligase)